MEGYWCTHNHQSPGREIRFSCPVSSYEIQNVQGIEVARLVEDEIVGGLHTFTGA